MSFAKEEMRWRWIKVFLKMTCGGSMYLIADEDLAHSHILYQGNLTDESKLLIEVEYFRHMRGAH